MAMPRGWKKKETKKLITLESEGYIIYVWKQGKNGYMIEAFKKGAGYKTRLFSKALTSRREADRFVSDLMKQKRIMRYTKFQPIFE